MDNTQVSPSKDIMDYAMSVTPLPDEQADHVDLPERISAYYSLVFTNYTYFVQTIPITIGRRSMRPGTPSSSDATPVYVDLGPLKSVSRLHAKIDYEESQERFVLVVYGRNGAWVDGVWSGLGSVVPLGARSQIQIATRVFDFVLPSSPAPEDSPSPSSPSSTSRHPSPSIDITSLSPDSSIHSPPPNLTDLPTEGTCKRPVDIASERNPPTKACKKRKKPGDSRPPPPAVMPPRPQFTYAQLCYRAITSLDGKATLQEICGWISENFDWYRYNEGSSGWESSIRHNLSSNKAFKKMERCAGERGKGFFWSVDPQHESSVKDQGGKLYFDSPKAKMKNHKVLDPPLKRSVKGDASLPLPPPLSGSPASLPTAHPPTAPTGHPHLQTCTTKFIIESPHVKKEQALGTRPVKVEPGSEPSLQKRETDCTASAASPNSTPGSNLTSLSPDIIIPIVIGPVPSSSSSETPKPKTYSTLDPTSPPIAFQRDTIVLNPTIFSSLTPIHLKELESLGAKKAIEILQTYIVRFLKEKRRAEGTKAKGKKKKDKSKKKDGASKERTTTGASRSLDTSKAESTSVKTEAGADTGAPSRVDTALLSPTTSGIAQAVGPLRISSPPIAHPAPSPTEEIDILGDDDEPASKKRRLEDMDLGIAQAVA